MLKEESYGGLFVLLGAGLLIIGFIWRSNLPFATTWPPLLIPAVVSLIYGSVNIWRGQRQRRSE